LGRKRPIVETGQLWKHYYGLPLLAPDVPGLITVTHVITNVQAGNWAIAVLYNNASEAHFRSIAREPDSYYTPDALAARGVR